MRTLLGTLGLATLAVVSVASAKKGPPVTRPAPPPSSGTADPGERTITISECVRITRTMPREDAAPNAALLIFGGEDHKTFLGCVTCDHKHDDWIFKKNGKHGPGGYGDNIWKSYGDFSGKYGALSPWNGRADDPPVVVDSQGNYYGRFVVDGGFVGNHRERTKVPELVILLAAIEAAREGR